MTDVEKMVRDAYPKIDDCSKGHRGPTVITIQWELTDEDRQEPSRVHRCGHCWAPTVPDAQSDRLERAYEERILRRKWIIE